ncbi:MAG: VWA domain-containing protein [Bacteroidaceae bacterium]|nr:VWA domain-containing protein [Bacteroidaceae bacterium]
MIFAHPEYFYLLLLLVPLIVWHFLMKRKKEPTLKIVTNLPFQKQRVWSLRKVLQPLPFILRLLTLVLLIIVLSRPQTHESLSESEREGIDIMIAMDISTSMLTPDLKPNRIEAAKQVAVEFIANRPNDNIGLTLFGGEAFTQCPLTMNHSALLSMFQMVTCDLQAHGVISPGTAVGMGLASAVTHLQSSKSKSKVVILLTDGANNVGNIPPLTAAELAKSEGIRVYTVALGRMGKTQQTVAQLANGETYEEEVENQMDTKTLQTIAAATNAQFYHAASKTELQKIYSEIDQLEKNKLKVTNYDKRYEAFQPFLIVAILSFLLEIILRLTLLRRLP